jgi:hypothetical protein
MKLMEPIAAEVEVAAIQTLVRLAQKWLNESS